LDIVKILIEKGANINYRGIYGDTSLNLVSIKGHLEIMKYLIDNGANIESKNENGNTPLSLAVKWSHVEIVKFLIEKGANINVKDINGNTPLSLALIWDEFDIINLLTINGAESHEIQLPLHTRSIQDCRSERGQNRTENVITLEKWDEDDRFVEFEDKYCYSFKEIKAIYQNEIKISPVSITPFEKNDFEKIVIIGRFF